jgi:hypothetical protein
MEKRQKEYRRVKESTDKFFDRFVRYSDLKEK